MAESGEFQGPKTLQNEKFLDDKSLQLCIENESGKHMVQTKFKKKVFSWILLIDLLIEFFYSIEKHSNLGNMTPTKEILV